jgi:hypothetical protein
MFTPAAAVYVAEVVAGSSRAHDPVLLPRSASRPRRAGRRLRVAAAIRGRSLSATSAATLRPRSA